MTEEERQRREADIASFRHELIAAAAKVRELVEKLDQLEQRHRRTG